MIKYRLYYFDSHGVSLRKITGGKNKEFESIEDAKYWIGPNGKSSRWIKNIPKHNQLVIVGDDGSGWKIIEIMEPNE
jgi:hypothetical protein